MVVNEQFLELAEKAGFENLKAHLAHAETLSKDASTTLTVLLAGTGGALAYTVKWFEAAAMRPILWGAVATTVWLACLSALLVLQCVRTVRTEMLYNEPMNLYKPELGLPILEARYWELANVQARITSTKARNRPIALWLDRIRIAAAASPLTFLGGVALGACL